MKEHTSILRINGLRGRMLYLSAPKDKKRNILLLYGHHASLERMGGISANFNRYGSLTLPDLPGFGGMDSFYKIGLEPSIDNYADYLASFIKLRFKRKRLTIVAISFSFPIVTKMLQKYPEMTKKVDILISCVGFVHHDDFRLPKWQQNYLKALAVIFGGPLGSFLFRYIFLQPGPIKIAYKLAQSRNTKMKDAVDAVELNKRIKSEIKLWQLNDVRTRMRTMRDMFRVNLCGREIDLSVQHVSVAEDRYFDNRVVEQHMKIIYKDFTDFSSEVPGHMPSIVATAEDAEPFVPAKLARILARSPK